MLALTDKYKLPAEAQLALIGGLELFVAPGKLMSLRDFHGYMDVLDEELSAPATPEPVKEPGPPAAPAAKPRVADIQTFFDRNLARHSLVKLVHLPIDGAVFERVGYDTARLVVPKAELATYRDVLANGRNLECADGEIVAGWYCIFTDGSTAAIAIVNGVSGSRAFVDAFLIIADGVHPTVPNPSLPPSYTLDDDFTFSYPDGTYKVIRLVPSTV